MWPRPHLLLVAFLTVVGSISALSEDRKKGQENYSLPEIYNVSSYDVDLTIPKASLTLANENGYTGTVTIQFSLTAVTDGYVRLHAHYDFIKIDRLILNNINLTSDSYFIDNATDVLYITPSSSLSVGEINKITIEYQSRFSTADKYGFYKSSYVNSENSTKYLARTKFGSTYARRAFPCFDEPNFKAKFIFSIKYSDEFNALSNTAFSSSTRNSQTGISRTTFKQTTKISTKSIAIILTELSCSSGESAYKVSYDSNYHLPKVFKVFSYDVDLTIPKETLTLANNNDFSGNVTVSFSLTAKSDGYVRLHAHHDYIQIQKLLFDDIDITSTGCYSIDNTTDILRIKPPSPLIIGETNKITIEYQSKLSNSDEYGFYKSNFTDKLNSIKYMARTNFNATYARRAFPCFDEPSFKAKFIFSIKYSDEFNALSNTAFSSSTRNSQTGISRTTFKQTPTMSTKSIALIISDLSCTAGESIDEVTRTDDYHLPKVYKVSSYNVDLTIPKESLTSTSTNDFSGNVTILFSLTAVSDGYIRLHAHHDFIQIQRLIFNDIDITSTGCYFIDESTDILRVEPPLPLTVGETNKITIEYQSRFSTTDKYGFYKSSYTNSNSVIKYLAKTNFESTYARRVFPCFDESSFKAKFTVSIQHHKDFNALSNTAFSSSTYNSQTGISRTTFKQTETMSTKSIAIMMSDFSCTAGESIDEVTHTSNYSLLDKYNVSSYEVDLTIPKASLTLANNNDYSGKVTILFSLTTKSDGYVRLHAHHEFIQIQRLIFNDLDITSIGCYFIDNTTDILRIEPPSPLTIGETNKITIEYQSLFSTTDKYGFYKNSYVNNESLNKFVIRSQLDSTHARRAFPCFDESKFKAKFTFSIVYPDEFNALSNTAYSSYTSNSQTGISRTTFKQTSKMPTKSIAILVTDLTCTSSQLVNKATRSSSYSLPKIYNISSYDVDLTIPKASLTLANENDYTGTVTIQFSLTAITDGYVRLHAHHDFIQIEKVMFNEIDITFTGCYFIDNATDILHIKPPLPLTVGETNKMTIGYQSRLSTTDKYGFYKSSYVTKQSSTKYLAKTQFVSTYARRAFPCFDETSFKSKFIFSITYPDEFNALSNVAYSSFTRNSQTGISRTTFKQTPKISTKSIALIISDLSCTAGESVDEVTHSDTYSLLDKYNVSSYEVDLTLSKESLTLANNNDYSGNATILFSLTNKSDGYVRLHAHHDFIQIQRLIFNDIDITSTGCYFIDNTTDILRIEPPLLLTVGETNKLTIEYQSHLSTTDKYGFFKTRYVNSDNSIKYLARAQFESAYARRAFPCFDEPRFKARFIFSIKYPDEFNALSNTAFSSSTHNSQTGISRTTFEQTAKMSTKSIAIIISDLSCSSEESVDEVADYTLSELYKVSSYDVDLIIPKASLTLANTNDFTGKVTIMFSLTAKSDGYVRLYAHHEFIQIQRILFNDTDITSTGCYSIDNTTDILRIKPPLPMTIGENFKISIEYQSQLSTSDKYGLYKSSYVNNYNSTKYLVRTEFQSTYARRAFPCFDEPSLKAKFTFSIQYAGTFNAFSNTAFSSSTYNSQTGISRTTFKQTPTMSTKSIAILISDLSCTAGQSIDEVTHNSNYRLSELYNVSSYDVDLTIPKESLTLANNNDFSGKVTILFSLTNKTDGYVRLHAQHNFIQIKGIKFNDLDITSAGCYFIDNSTDVLRVEPPLPLTINETNKITIEYQSELSTADKYGFYKSSYVNSENSIKYLARTQFESRHARRTFPCFDEPSFKAKFTFSIKYPKEFNALSNTAFSSFTSNSQTGISRTNFKQTPTISTKSIAIILSDLSCSAGESVDEVAHQVCSRTESQSNRALALEVSPQLLASLSNFTGVKYNESITKMDQVAIPNLDTNDMENWGLVIYREADILWNQNESSNKDKQRVVMTVANKFAHQWFGNLVTMKWSSESFLNEGFAKYLEYHVADETYPTWKLTKQFVIEKVQNALVSDAFKHSQALLQSSSVNTDIISSNSSSISYSKSAVILRMVEKFMGIENFKAGITQFLTINAMKSTEQENLWEALDANIDDSLSEMPEKLETVMENWLKASGFPVLTAHVVSDGILHIKQERFSLSGMDTESSTWYVPITFTSSEDDDKFQKTTPSTWLTTTDHELYIRIPENANWVILNNQMAGYYRVNYDQQSWKNIGEALLSNNFGDIIEISRAQLVDDLLNLARAGYITYPNAFSVLQFLSNENSYFTWYPAFNGYNFLLEMVGGSSKLGAAISADLLSLMNSLLGSVSFDVTNEDDQIATLNQVQTLTWACKLGQEECISEAQTQFDSYKSTSQRPNKNLRSIIYCNALRNSNDLDDWTFLWNAYLNAEDLETEQLTILTALGCTKDKTTLEEYLKETITNNSGIRLQDAPYVFSAVYSGSSEGVDVALDFLLENYPTIFEKYQDVIDFGTMFKNLAEKFTSDDQISKLEEFMGKTNLSETLASELQAAKEIANSNLNWLSQNRDDLKNYYNVNRACRIGNSLLVVLLAVVLNKFLF